jgi:hypothetical protein
LDQALQLHPKERIKASQALQHPFLKQYLDADMKGFRDRVIRRATLDTYGKTRAAERHWFLGGATTTGDAKRGNDPDDDDCDDDDADDAQVENAAEDDDDDKNNNNSDENGEGQNDGRIVDAKDGNNRSKSYIAELLRQYERPSSSDGEGYN